MAQMERQIRHRIHLYQLDAVNLDAQVQQSFAFSIEYSRGNRDDLLSGGALKTSAEGQLLGQDMAQSGAKGLASGKQTPPSSSAQILEKQALLKLMREKVERYRQAPSQQAGLTSSVRMSSAGNGPTPNTILSGLGARGTATIQKGSLLQA